jgi:hypothetical protein
MTKTHRLILLGTVFVVAGIVAFAIILRNRPDVAMVPPPSDQPATQTPEGTANLQVQAIQTRTEAGTEVTLNLSPLAGEQEVSTLGLDIIFQASKGSLFPRSSNPTMGPAFRGNGWTIPFSDLVSNNDGTVTLKMTAIYASPSPFSFSETLELVSFSLGGLDTDATLSYTINDPEVSKAFDKSGNLVNFTRINQPLTIAE